MHKLFNVLIIAVLLLICCSQAYGQNYPVYNYYYINPYVYNPAEVATENTYIFFDHKRQWMGLPGAPVLSSLSFNTLLNHTRSGIGVKASNYKRGILSSTDISFAYAYGLLLNKQKSTFFFGMSAGLISNSIDMSQLTEDDLSDPVLANYLANNIQPAANFGMLLRAASGVNIGLTLPQLFTPDFNAETHFDASGFSPLDNAIVSFYYKKQVDGKLVHRKKRGIRAKVKTAKSAAPVEFYSFYKYNAQGPGQLETTLKLNLSPYFWLAGGYRLSYGLTAGTGFSLGNLILGYSYEPGGQPQSGFSRGSHEILLGIKIGDPKIFKHTTPLIRSMIKTAPNEQHLARFQQTQEDPTAVEDPQNQPKKKFYVILRGFGDFTSADNYKKKILEQKFNADIFYHEKEKKFYVFVFQSTKAGEAHEEARNLKNYTKLKEARVLEVDEPK